MIGQSDHAVLLGNQARALGAGESGGGWGGGDQLGADLIAIAPQ